MVVLPVSTTSELLAKVLAFTEPLILTADAVALATFLAFVRKLFAIPGGTLFPVSLFFLIEGNSKADRLGVGTESFTEDDIVPFILASTNSAASISCTFNNTAHIRHTIPAQWR